MKNKKIGILTFQESNNYGAMLQAYALREAIINLGYNADIINYHCKNKESQYSTKFSFKRKLLVNINILLSASINKKRGVLFDQFRTEQLGIDEKKINYTELSELNEKYDLFVCGSDQIWNPESTRRDSAYFLDFVHDAHHRISYAPSVGVRNINSDDIDFFVNGVRGIERLSVREKSAAKLIKDLVNRNAEVVVDPTLLIGIDKWNELSNIPIYNGNYILFYNLDYSKNVVNNVKVISNKLGLPVVIPVRTIRDYKDGFIGFVGGPREFLSAVKNADYVLTTSFHGMMMSIIFKKNFLVFDKAASKNKLGSRIDDFLELMDLQERKFSGDYSILNKSIDFDELEKKITKSKNESLSYLDDSLNLC